MNPLEHYEELTRMATADLVRSLRGAAQDMVSLAQQIESGGRPPTHTIRATVADVEQHCLAADKARAASEAARTTLEAAP